MSDLSASVTKTSTGLKVAAYEKLDYDFHYVEGVFNIMNDELAACYAKWGRVLVVLDRHMKELYGHQIQAYFDHYQLPLSFHAMSVGEKAKNIESLLGICDAMTKFGVIRKEPVLVVGGGLVTDVAGFACACYRRNTNFIRIPTTLIGLIDASVSIKVAVNYGHYKNRLGAYHAPIHTFLDFSFLKTLPLAQVRNGFAELVKISSCAHLPTFDALSTHCKELLDSKFGQEARSTAKIRSVAKQICEDAIYEMLRLETPNLHEIMLDRIIAFGHTWSPYHELRPDPPLRHGHAISIDMAFTVTLAMSKGMLSEKEHARFFDLLSRAGLAIDHALFDNDTIQHGLSAILKTRGGLLRLATPHPLGQCTFVNEYSIEHLQQVLKLHKQLAARYPRQGAGIEAVVGSSDTGEGFADGLDLVDAGGKPTSTDTAFADIANGRSHGGRKVTINGTKVRGPVANGHS